MRIRYYGHVGQRTGYGVAATQMCLALSKHEDVDLEICPDFERCDRALIPEALQPLLRGDGAHPKPDAIIVHSLPGDCERILKEALANLPGRHDDDYRHPTTVVYTTWEGTSVPSNIHESLSCFEQVWVPSEVTSEAFKRDRFWNTPIDIDGKLKIIPHTYDSEIPRVSARPLDANFRFYWIGAWMARKNPMGLLRAFMAEFSAQDDVELFLHSAGTPTVLFQLALASTGLDAPPGPGRTRVLFSNENLPDEGMEIIHRDGDCFVTAARGEAWNLPAFDAMLAGRNVISPSELGSDEFLKDTSAYRYESTETYSYLDARVVAPPAGSPPGAVAIMTLGGSGMTSRTKWMEPDLEELALAMRAAYKARRRTLQLHYDPATRFGHAAVARLAVNALREG